MRIEQEKSGKSSATNRHESLQSQEDARRFYRVSIHLPIAIRQQNSEVLISESLDISEGGVLVKNSGEHQLKKGDLVKVHIEGILGEDQDQMVLHPMRVMRIEEDTIALEFT
ncbi:PilZ domain-containing protein [Kangiella spongicola]|jgi:c-di-GMP-binding flagellar brake protein YcgR|uniref:Pilus assembly protein PilZ n=1 Tax=Kangiella spongicola TaxID=796379 RepID=A0A318DAJ4_9GAMM|nr:PilZ domain-containing protein [Kangiella spongicola]MBV34696.1 pilus assembly protein PilZ [Rickettsiales bacterium]PXF63937.1 pilus assembly protein PilZ [Kangiella spongicola]